MKTRRTSYGFLMEMLWVCAFFLISACIFVLAFAKSEQMSRDADTLNQAVLAASNAMEETFALYESGTDAADSSGNIEALAAACSFGEFTLRIETTLEDSFLQVTIRVVSTRDGSEIYTLEGSHFLPEPGIQNADRRSAGHRSADRQSTGSRTAEAKGGTP